MAKLHKINLSPVMLAHIAGRRDGRLHAIERIDPKRTALVVIDMQNVWVKQGGLAYSPYCEGIVPNINRLAASLRDYGGSVWWVRALYKDDAPRTWSAYMEFRSPQFVRAMLAALSDESEAGQLFQGLEVQPEDRHVVKRRFSAMIQGASDLHDRLQAEGIDTLIITGTATNVCCESTARDAFMLNYRTIVVSDGNATASDEAHNASLSALMMQFSDVYNTDETIELIKAQAGSREKRAS